MYQPVVQLKSGGYLVINPTEALVSIDINSGRSTREHNIEQTAFATNLEAAHEIARQLRLRDMAGLVVIDFIDMEQSSHVRKVEKAMKDALKNDRARIQVGRISSFGLMEMSRQRLRTGVLEASTKACPHCEGTGLMRTASSAGLSALRIIEDEAARGRGDRILLRAGREAAIYVLNKKRAELAEIEERYGVTVEVADRRELRRRADERRKLGRAARAQGAPGIARRSSTRTRIIDVEDRRGRGRGGGARPSATRREREPRRPREAAKTRTKARAARRRRRRGGRGRSRRDGERRGRRAHAETAGEPAEAERAAERETTLERRARPRARSAKPRRGRRGGRGRRGRGEAGGRRGRDATPATSSPTARRWSRRPIAEEPPIAAEAEAEPRRGKAQDPPPSARPQGVEPRRRAEAAAERPGSRSCRKRRRAEAEAPAKPKRRSRAKKAEAAPKRRAAAEEAVPMRRRRRMPAAKRRRPPATTPKPRPTTAPATAPRLVAADLRLSCATDDEAGPSIVRGPAFIRRSGARWDSGRMTFDLAGSSGSSCSALALAFAAARPAAAQSILRDSETELLFRDMSKPLIEAAGLDPTSVKVVLLNDPEINAFVAQGQVVYIHSGPARRGRQCQPAAGRHRPRAWPRRRRPRDPHRRGRRARRPRSSILVAGARRRGDRRRRGRRRHGHHGGRASRPRWATSSPSPAPRNARADLAGAAYLSKAGISGKGSLEFFKKLQNQEYRLAIYAKDSYDRTHPLSSERIASARAGLSRRTRPGTGRPIRRSRRASSGSRPS